MQYKPLDRQETTLIELGVRATVWFYAGWHTIARHANIATTQCNPHWIMADGTCYWCGKGRA